MELKAVAGAAAALECGDAIGDIEGEEVLRDLKGEEIN